MFLRSALCIVRAQSNDNGNGEPEGCHLCVEMATTVLPFLYDEPLYKISFGTIGNHSWYISKT